MGTRGAFGVIIGEKEKIGYNQFDSYPEGCGIENLQWLRDADPVELKRLATEARVVSDELGKPTPEDVKNLAATTDLGVSNQTTDDWYCLTREAHGHIGKMLDSGYVYDSSTFPLDSLFCEWAYIVDLDGGVFEVYEGFQKEPHQEGRFADRLADPEKSASDQEYYPVKLVASWPLDDLPSDDEFLAWATALHGEKDEADVPS